MVEAKTTMGDVIDDVELKSICLLADELNERIVKTNNYMDINIRADFKFKRSNSKADHNLIGRLEIGILRSSEQHDNHPKSEYLRTLSMMSPLPSQSNKSSKSPLNSGRSKTVHFKLPFNCKNMILAVLANKTVVKVSESALIDEYSYVLNLALVNSFESNKNSARVKASEEIGSFRLKKVQTSFANNFIVVNLVNKFLNTFNHLKLYDADLTCVKSLDVNYKPIEIFMNKKGIYVLAVSETNKNHLNIYRYDYEMKEQEVFYFIQYTKPSSINQEKFPRHFFIEKNLKLVGVESDNFYFLDSEKNRVKILTKSGETKNVKIGEEYDNERKDILLVKVDTTERINVLNRKTYKIEAYSSAGAFLAESKVDTKIQSIDTFFVFDSDKSYCVVDRKNCVINFQ
jgi:hypothetical protein